MKTKTIWTISIMLIALFISSHNIFAQNNDQSYTKKQEKVKKTPEEKATKVADRMKKNLSLSDEQYKEIYNLVFEKAGNKSLNKEKHKSMDKEARKELKKQNKEAFNKQIENILSKDQYAKWLEMKANHKKNWKNKNKNNPELKN